MHILLYGARKQKRGIVNNALIWYKGPVLIVTEVLINIFLLDQTVVVELSRFVAYDISWFIYVDRYRFEKSRHRVACDTLPVKCAVLYKVYKRYKNKYSTNII